MPVCQYIIIIKKKIILMNQNYIPDISSNIQQIGWRNLIPESTIIMTYIKHILISLSVSRKPKLTRINLKSSFNVYTFFTSDQDMKSLQILTLWIHFQNRCFPGAAEVETMASPFFRLGGGEGHGHLTVLSNRTSVRHVVVVCFIWYK